MFHLVSLSLQISQRDLPGPCLGLCVGVACFVACLGGLVVGFFLTGKFDLNHMLIPVSRKRPRRVPSKKGLSLKIVIKHRPKFY